MWVNNLIKNSIIPTFDTNKNFIQQRFKKKLTAGSNWTVPQNQLIRL